MLHSLGPCSFERLVQIRGLTHLGPFSVETPFARPRRLHRTPSNFNAKPCHNAGSSSCLYELGVLEVWYLHTAEEELEGCTLCLHGGLQGLIRVYRI